MATYISIVFIAALTGPCFTVSIADPRMRGLSDAGLFMGMKGLRSTGIPQNIDISTNMSPAEYPSGALSIDLPLDIGSLFSSGLRTPELCVNGVSNIGFLPNTISAIAANNILSSFQSDKGYLPNPLTVACVTDGSDMTRSNIISNQASPYFIDNLSESLSNVRTNFGMRPYRPWSYPQNFGVQQPMTVTCVSESPVGIGPMDNLVGNTMFPNSGKIVCTTDPGYDLIGNPVISGSNGMSPPGTLTCFSDSLLPSGISSLGGMYPPNYGVGQPGSVVCTADIPIAGDITGLENYFPGNYYPGFSNSQPLTVTCVSNNPIGIGNNYGMENYPNPPFSINRFSDNPLVDRRNMDGFDIETSFPTSLLSSPANLASLGLNIASGQRSSISPYLRGVNALQGTGMRPILGLEAFAPGF